MSSRRNVGAAAALLCLLLLFVGGARANAQEAAKPPPPEQIDDRAVMEIALARNPSLAAAITDLRRAQLLEEAEEHRYPLTLLLNGQALRNGAPQLATSGGVTFPTSTSYLIGSELQKKLAWGTELSLRVETSRNASTSIFSFAVPGGTPTQTLFQLGPGYGGLVRLGITQPLLRGAGRDVVFAQLEAAKTAKTTSAFTRDRTASQLLLDSLTAYWELYYSSRTVEIQKRSLELANAQRDDTAARVKTGSVAPVELLTFDTRIATLEEDVVSAEAEERRRSTALERLLGDPALVGRRAANQDPVQKDTVPTGDLRRRVLDASPEVAEQRSAVTLAEVQARTAADALRQKLDLGASVQANGLGNQEVPPLFSQIGTLKAITAQVTLTYEAPLDDTRHRAENDRAQLAITAAKQRLDATTQKVLADLDNAERDRSSAARRIDLTARTLTVAQAQLDAEKARFKTGTGTALQVRVAEDQLRTSELRTVRARVDLVIADLAMLHVTGTLLPQFAR